MEKQLYEACKHGKVEEVQKLLQNSQININWQHNDFGKTPLYIACCGWTPFYSDACANGYTEIVKLLLNDNRVDINKANNDGKTPFHGACYYGKTEVVKYLLESGREIDIKKKDKDGKSALDYARQERHIDIVKLIESFRKNPNEIRAQLRKEFGNLYVFLYFFFFTY